MQPVVETLSGLERRIDLEVAIQDIETEVAARLKKMSRTAKMAGFRPGKVPMSMLERSYGPELRYEAINQKVGEAFNAAVKAATLRVAGAPRLEPKAVEGEAANEQPQTLRFSAVFEVYPEVALPDFSAVSVTRAQANVGDAEIDRTIEILRKQRATFEAVDRESQKGDRVKVDFEGRLDGTPFDGGTATDFPFELGGGQMLAEFDAAATGLKTGETKVFPLTFPADYGAENLAGKTVEFTITLKSVEQPVLPEVDADFVKSLGIESGDLAELRADILRNLEREVSNRLLARTKQSVMDALVELASFDLPKALVEDDVQSQIARAREDLRQRGMPNADTLPIPPEAFSSQAERRVRLGLLVAELVRQESLQAKPEQVRAKVESIASAYEQPGEVMNYYLGSRERLAELEAIVLEDNVVDFVLGRAQVTNLDVSFDDLMGRS